MPRRMSAADQVVEGQVLHVVGPPADQGFGPGAVIGVQGSVVSRTPDTVQDTSLSDALQKARALSLFVQIPFLAFTALHPKVPGLIRLGAGALAIWQGIQIASQAQEISTYLPEQL